MISVISWVFMDLLLKEQNMGEPCNLSFVKVSQTGLGSNLVPIFFVLGIAPLTVLKTDFIFVAQIVGPLVSVFRIQCWVLHFYNYLDITEDYCLCAFDDNTGCVHVCRTEL